LLAIAALVSGFLASATANTTPPLYTITDLGTFGGTASSGNSVDARGEVTGGANLPGDFSSHAFIYSNGSLQDLGTLGPAFDDSLGNGINDSGDVAGTSEISGNGNGSISHAFLYNNGVMHDLGTNGGPDSSALAINDKAQITGYYVDTSGNRHAFIYTKGAIKDIGGFDSVGFGINASGEITGETVTQPNGFRHAFLYSKGTMHDLGTLGGDTSEGVAINNSGEVIGGSNTVNGAPVDHVFLYKDGLMIDLGILGGGRGINDKAEVVGTTATSGGAPQEFAFLYYGGTILNLNKLIVPTDPLYNSVQFSDADGINNAGQIVANGCYTSGPLNGQCHAFRLDPVPVFAGTPGKANCYGKSVSALVQRYKGLNAAAAALGYPSVKALQKAIMEYCEG
jgi:probable HAF family extracellular repeat protein